MHYVYEAMSNGMLPIRTYIEFVFQYEKITGRITMDVLMMIHFGSWQVYIVILITTCL